MNWTLFLDWILYDVLASPINTYMILKQQPVPCVQLLLYDFSGNTTTDLHRCALYHHRMRLLLFAYCRLCFRLCEPRPSDFSLRFFGFWYFYWFQIVFEFCVGYSFDLWFHSTIHESIVWHSIGSSVRRWMQLKCWWGGCCITSFSWQISGHIQVCLFFSLIKLHKLEIMYTLSIKVKQMNYVHNTIKCV